MLIKFETHSKRVKGISFHPKRPWILSSLHSGVIQLWDYRMGTLLDQFHEHEGPVRGIDFHLTQPLFVSGGDDYKIKVWNLKSRKCLFTLLGHSDYVRTTFFHTEQPWILSCSDDQTVRLWNWQSRTCLAILTGHNHYVMCAKFHPTQDLIISCSLDQTIRIWDISGLKKRSSGNNIGGVIGGALSNVLSGSGVNVNTEQIQQKVSQINQDLFGSNDVSVKYILEGHIRGVNWVSFHPSNPELIVSGSDDCDVKIWKIEEDKAYEVNTLSSHFKNVSCVEFLPKDDLIISNSEDKSIRVWKQKGTLVLSFKKEQERFWILAVHPKQNLIAAGHDNGLLIFKLKRERPAFCNYENNIFYLKEKYIRKYDITNSKATPIILFKKLSGQIPKDLFYDSQESMFIITSSPQSSNSNLNSNDNNLVYYDIIKYPKNSTTVETISQSDIIKGGLVRSVTFCGSKKIAILENGSTVVVKNISNNQSKKYQIDISNLTKVFNGTPGRIILTTPESVHLYDFEQKKIISSISINNVKYVSWSNDMTRVAFISKHVITMTNGQLEFLTSVHETIRIKSGNFDDQNIFVYSTLNHMKYLLEWGDYGSIFTLPRVSYIAKVKGNSVHFVDREAIAGLFNIDEVEYSFKKALFEGQINKVKKIIGSSVILGDSIIAYLQQKGYPELALKFVHDDNTKFDLAIECGRTDIALQVAHKIDKKECWEKLCKEALLQGNYDIVEKCYQQTNQFDKLSFLYLITGNIANLGQMLKLANLRKDIMSRFHNSLFLGDVEEKIKVLKEVGLIHLAYGCAKIHGLNEIADQIGNELKNNNLELPILPENSSLLFPPIPINVQPPEKQNWQLLHSILDYKDEDEEKEEKKKELKEEKEKEKNIIDSKKWGDIDEIQIPDENSNILNKKNENMNEKKEAGGWDTLDIKIEDLPKNENENKNIEKEEIEKFKMPEIKEEFSNNWINNSEFPCDHIAAGSFQSAMNILNQNAGIINFFPLKNYFLSIYAGSKSVLSTNIYPSIFYLERFKKGDFNKNSKFSLPSLAIYSNFEEIDKKLKIALNAMDDGYFEKSLSLFRDILQQLIFIPIASRKKEREIREILNTCSEYIIGTRLEITRRKLDIQKDPVKVAELSSYFTRCKLKNVHVILSLISAMNVNYKIGNIITASEFAKRLLKLNPDSQKTIQTAQYIISLAEKKGEDKHKLNYNEKNPFSGICSLSLQPIYSGDEFIKCPYCFATYLPKFKGKLCCICELAEIGKKIENFILDFNKKFQKKIEDDNEEGKEDDDEQKEKRNEKENENEKKNKKSKKKKKRR